jgi:hypothetical protein
MIKVSTILGIVIWLAACLWLRLPLEGAILLFAPLVLVPLGLKLIEDPASAAKESMLRALAWRFSLPAAVALSASFAFEQGYVAAALAAPWFLITVLLAVAGVFRLRPNGWRLNAEFAATAALLFIPVGGGWAVISRAGLRPQDFSHAIVLLTAVHFHYAGFVLPILASCAIRPRLAGESLAWVSQFDQLMLLCIVVGVPAVGVGISLSRHIEVVAALVLAVGCWILAARQVQAALTTGNPTRVSLAIVSSLSLVSAMALATIYAIGEFTGQRWLEIPTMIRTHGAFNAFGFAGCGIAAWAVSRADK